MPQRKRKCEGCTACCDGWLAGEALGIKFQSGKPCHFRCEGKCAIYKDRPAICKNFECEWITNLDLPEWMKPNICGVIVTKKGWGPNRMYPYYQVLELGKKIDSVVLNWFFEFSVKGGNDLMIMVDGGWFYYGSKEFREWVGRS